MAFENDFVSLEEPQQPADAGISLQITPNSQELPIEDTNLRASKAHLALGDSSPGLDVLQNQFATGQENNVRQKMSVDVDNQNRVKTAQMLDKVATTEGPLTPEDVDFTMHVMRTKPVDPSVVLETEFGKQFAQYATTAAPEVNQVFSKAWQYTPSDTAFELNVTGNLIAKGSIAQHKLQELEERWKKTPWLAPMDGNPSFQLNNSKGAIDAYIHSLIPFVPWSIMRNSLEGMPATSWLPGNNVAEQVQSAWLIQDPKQFKDMVEVSLEKVWNKNPLEALTMARALVNFSSSDQLLGNVYGWADIASVAPIGTAIRLAGRGIAATSAKLSGQAAKGTEALLNSRYDLGKFNPYAFEVDRVGPASDLLPQEVRDAGRKIASQAPEGPVMNAKRGQTFDINRGPTMQVERGPAWEIPPQGVTSAIGEGVDLPLRGPVSPSRLPQREGDVTREQFMASWARYYQQRPYMGVDVNRETGEFPAALIPRGQEGVAEEVKQQARNAFWDVVRAGNEKKIDPERALVILGDIPTAARVGATRLLTASVNPAIGAEATLYDLSKDIPSVFNPMTFMANLGNMNQEAARRLFTRLQARGEAYMEGFTGKGVIERLPPEAQEQAYKEAEKTIRNEFHSLNDYVANVVRNPRDVYKNTDSVSIQMGDKGGQLFESSAKAELFAKDVFKLPEGSYTIKQQGISFWVDIQRPIDETLGSVRDLLNATKYSQTPSNRISSLLFGTWSPRSAEDLLSAFNRDQRHIATHAPQNLRALFIDFAEDISGLNKKARNEVQDVLRANRDFVDPITQDRGKFYQTVGDWQVAFQNKHGKMPADAQTQAYFSFVQLSDMDWVMRNFGWLRDKERQGIQNHRFQLGEGPTPWIEGRVVQSLPITSEDAGILIMKDKGNGQFVRKHNDPDFDPKAINKMVNEEGYSIIQIANPTVRPLKELTGETDMINFVITNTKETKGLGWKQAEYRPGGHVMYPYEHWVAQPQIAVGRGGKYFYYGDSNIFNFSSAKEAQMWAERMDEGRRMLLNNDPNLGSFVSKNLPYSEDEFKKLFQKYLDPELPISHKESGRSTIQTDTRLKDIDKFKEMRNDLDSSYNLYNQLDRTYLSERDLQLGTIAPTGDVLKPWRIEAAPAIDPYPMMNRALGQAIRSRYMTDYKIAAAEEWVQQFGKLLEGKEAQLRKNPLSVLYNGRIGKSADSSISREEIIAAENARARIKDFIGSQSEFESNLTRVQSLIMDSAFTALGKGKADYVAAHLLPQVTDPSSYFRAIAFHTKLGLFNPVQLFVQAQSMANSIAVAGPIHGGKGMAAAGIQRYLSLTEEPAVIARAAEMAESFGWKAEHFKESYEAFKQTGLWHVAGETAWRDDVFDPKIFTGAVGKFLEKGTIPFAEGERMSRMTAWNAAYSEWRAANPTKEITNRDISSMLNRADTLSVNMTRASNAAWQKGIFSIPGQFAAYSSRMTEMFLGGRLSVAEKANALLTYSVLYGVPVATSATVGVWPWYEDTRQALIARGKVPDDTVLKAFHEGLLSVGLAAITGTDYNVAQRFGPNPQNILKEAWKGNKTAIETLGGPSYSVMRDILKTTMPLYETMASSIFGDGTKSPLLIDDLKTAAENVSSASLAIRMYTAMNIGKYVTKNEVKVTDVTNMDTIMMVLGLTKQSVADVFHAQTYLKDIKKHQDEQVKEASLYYRRGIEAAAKGNAEESKASQKRAEGILEAAGMDAVQRSKVFKQVMQGSPMDTLDKVNSDLLKKGPIQNRPALIQNMINKRQGITP